MTHWKCSCCGEVHDSIPNSFAFDEPIYWGNRRRFFAPKGCWINKDYCVIDSKGFYIRATLEIPILGSEDIFVFGVWSSLSQINFERERKLAKKKARLQEPPYFGWFSNRIWQYPDTLNLKCNVISREPGLRPCIELQPTDHPLAIEQRSGISRERFMELSEQCMHGWQHPDSGIDS